VRVALLAASSPREVSDMGGTTQAANHAADDRWVNIWPRLAAVHLRSVALGPNCALRE
jgi:hypothetical protein